MDLGPGTSDAADVVADLVGDDPPDPVLVPGGDPRPRSRLTPRVRRDVIVDRAAYSLVTSRATRPDDAALARIAVEVDEALALFGRRGWLEAPAHYHRDPPPPGGVRTTRQRSGSIRYTAISWADGYAPRPDEPGAARFAGYRSNRIARAALLEHRGPARPWLICLHGFGMGRPGLDLRAFRALHLHRALGLNVALLTLPFHGRRHPGRATSPPPMPSAELLDTVHGLAQAVWDARQLLALVRRRTEHPVGIMGLSLGGLVASLVASIDDPDAALLLVPAVDLPALMTDAIAGEEVADEITDEVVERARRLFAPVSPLRLSPRVPVEDRFVVAGTLDRFARPTSQAIALWRHWDEPALHWYHGGHVSLFWARGVQAEIDGQLRRSGLEWPQTDGG